MIAAPPYQKCGSSFYCPGGRKRAICHKPKGHDGTHHNGTQTWTDEGAERSKRWLTTLQDADRP